MIAWWCALILQRPDAEIRKQVTTAFGPSAPVSDNCQGPRLELVALLLNTSFYVSLPYSLLPFLPTHSLSSFLCNAESCKGGMPSAGNRWS